MNNDGIGDIIYTTVNGRISVINGATETVLYTTAALGTPASGLDPNFYASLRFINSTSGLIGVHLYKGTIQVFNLATGAIYDQVAFGSPTDIYKQIADAYPANITGNSIEDLKSI